MRMIRRALLDRTIWLAWACALALAVRMLIPTGYMPTEVGGLPAIAICDGTGTAMMTMQMPAMPGMDHGHGEDHKRADSSCPFAIAAMASLGGADVPVLAALVIAPFVIGYILGRTSPRLRTARLRPPAQGPPTL